MFCFDCFTFFSGGLDLKVVVYRMGGVLDNLTDLFLGSSVIHYVENGQVTVGYSLCRVDDYSSPPLSRSVAEDFKCKNSTANS